MIENKSDTCFNCKNALENNENYCPNCGQKNTDLNISVAELFRDFASDYFTFDSKFFNTFGPLIFKPGKVPKEYIDGQRVKHIPPLRIFIFLSFITFFLWGLSFESDQEEVEDEEEKITATAPLKKPQEIIDSLNSELPLSIKLSQDSSANEDEISNSLNYIINKENKPQEIVDSLAKDKHEIIRKLMVQGLRMYQAEEGVVYDYLMGNISIVLLMLQPFFALLLKLFYIRRKSFFYIEHLVFSLYYHAFILMATIFIFFMSFYFDPEYGFLLLTLLAFFYFLLASKRFYEQSWGKTLVKSTLISLIYQVTMFPFFILVYLFLSLYFY